MFEITRKKELNPTVTLMDIKAPYLAKKAEPGQFIILRVDEDGERIPLTIADYNREEDRPLPQEHRFLRLLYPQGYPECLKFQGEK